MSQLPIIYTIQASDAPQHTGRLKEILQNMETENRISSFNVLRPDDDLSSITENLEEEDLILIVLTRQLEEQKEQIEKRFKTLNTVNPRVAEIIVDNVVYDNEFITFPADLRPIRDREDMDGAWNGIKQNLMELFPAREWDLPEWLRGDLEWPWKSPERWHGALLLGLTGTLFVAIAQFVNYVNDPRGLSLLGAVGFSILLAGPLYAIAGAISGIRKAPLFFSVAGAIGLMGLWIIFFGTYEDVVGAALVAGGPVSAIVGAAVGRSHNPFRLGGMIFLGMWPFLFSEAEPFGVDGAFLVNPVFIAAVLCLLAWMKPVEPIYAVKVGTLPFALNLAGGFLIYLMAAEQFLTGSAVLVTLLTAVAATSLAGVYWINHRRVNGANQIGVT